MCKKKNPNTANICFDCENAVCGCSWSRSFEPVPGWTAEKVIIEQVYRKGFLESYHITACPQFVSSNEDRPVICVNTGVVYPTLEEAETQTGIRKGGIRDVLKGRRHTVCGTVWRYAEVGDGHGE